MRRTISAARFEAIVEQALDSLPAAWAARLDNVAIVIQDEPEPELLAELGLDPTDANQDLLGLYQGTPQSVRDGGWELPDRIVIYRGATLREAGHRSEIAQIVRETLLHEIGHHFGLEEDDLPF